MDDRQVADIWERGDAYERFIGRWSRHLAPRFLAWLGIPPGRTWLDVGCGTGALTAAILDCCGPAAVTGVEPSAGFLQVAQDKLAGRARLCAGSASAIPLENASVDVAVAGLVLNFVPDPLAAVAEMVRVTVEGGTIAAYVWDCAGKMDILRLFWNAAVALDPAVAPLDEGVRFPLCRPNVLSDLFATAGLTSIELSALEIPTPFANFDEYWQPFLGGQGPGPAYLMSLGETARGQLKERLRESLPAMADGCIPLTARSWAIRAQVPSQ